MTMHEVMMHVNKNANCNHKNHEFFTIMPTIKEFTTKNAFKIATSISVPNFPAFGYLKSTIQWFALIFTI